MLFYLLNETFSFPLHLTLLMPGCFSAATRDLPSVTSSDTCNGVNSNVGVHGEKECESESENTKVLNVFNEDLLSLPVKQFIAESVQHFVIGLPSHSLTQLILYFVTLLNPNFAKEIKENKKLTTTTDDLCKKVIPYYSIVQFAFC